MWNRIRPLNPIGETIGIMCHEFGLTKTKDKIREKQEGLWSMSLIDFIILGTLVTGFLVYGLIGKMDTDTEEDYRPQ